MKKHLTDFFHPKACHRVPGTHHFNAVCGQNLFQRIHLR
ncbi:hypothetical protein EVA_02761 [gut metagenome]|uniref:Uncharacterized protein n=1 Tax=gut metagenome TaxID=749906 RepID=J9H5E1_9ZZZZ